MAGACGYETEHFDLSIRMAERCLAPAVRAAASEDTLIAASGVSCRAQILDTTVIRFDVPEATHVSLIVYDVLGRAVARLFEGLKEAGMHHLVWQASTARRKSVSSLAPS